MSHIDQKNTFIKGSLELPLEIETLEHNHISMRRKNCSKRFADMPQKQSSAREENNVKESLTGLAISGGGIRSASFALGVMQALESEGLMKRFDYLSTVSGGGYIGGSLSWFLNRNAKKQTDKFNFKENEYPWPWGTEDPQLANRDNGQADDSKQQKSYLDYFRQHGKYLIPGSGITQWSLVSVIIRAVFLNLIVYIPLITALITFFLIALTDKEIFFLGAPPDAIRELMFPLYAVQQNVMSAWLLVSAGIIAILGSITALGYSVSTRLGQMVGFTASKYKFRRFTERYSGYALVIFIAFFLGGMLPVINQALYDLTSGMNLGWSNGVLVPIVGVIIALLPMYKLFKQQLNQSMGIFIQISVSLLILGLLLSAYNLALASISLAGETSGFGLGCSDFHCYQWHEVMLAFLSVKIFSIPYFWLIMLGISLVSGVFVNLNYISIHRFYRDRLMEAYMQEVDTVLNGKTTSAKHADHLKIHDLYNNDEIIAPFHLINTNVILVGDEDNKYKNRGGDNFVISPGYCGSTATGWNRAYHFMDNKMTLPTAVAISGAAANPDTAPGGKGLTRSRAVSLLMSIFNLRLGYWAPNPKNCRDIYGYRRVSPNHFQAALYEARMDADKENAYVQLSDGGHFENLAVYELIRRRCKVIVLSDAAADPQFGFSDLQILIRRIEQDFNTTIVFKGDNDIAQMIPSIKKLYPEKLKVAKKGFVIGEIIYPEIAECDQETKEKAYLIYIKSTLVEGLDTKLLGYKSLNSAYPDESTADQFFDAEQFDAYRELGYALCRQMLADTGKKYILGEF